MQAREFNVLLETVIEIPLDLGRLLAAEADGIGGAGDHRQTFLTCCSNGFFRLRNLAGETFPLTRGPPR